MQDRAASNTPVRGVSWAELCAQRSDLAVAGRELVYHFGVGLAFMSTVRRGGGPRLHPICPLITDAGIYGFIIPSPKLTDLLRDGRYALHSYPLEDNEDAFYVTGTAIPLATEELRRSLERQFLEERPNIDLSEDALSQQTLVEFFIEHCLLTRTVGHGDPNPRHEIWHAR